MSVAHDGNKSRIKSIIVYLKLAKVNNALNRNSAI